MNDIFNCNVKQTTVVNSDDSTDFFFEVLLPHMNLEAEGLKGVLSIMRKEIRGLTMTFKKQDSNTIKIYFS